MDIFQRLFVFPHAQYITSPSYKSKTSLKWFHQVGCNLHNEIMRYIALIFQAPFCKGSGFTAALILPNETVLTWLIYVHVGKKPNTAQPLT